MSQSLPIERKFELIEQAFGIGPRSGRVPGTALSRTLLPEEMGGGQGWCLSVGPIGMPKSFFYSKTIVGCFAKARNAGRAGKIEAPTVTSIIG
jgi:hypothetical protein